MREKKVKSLLVNTVHNSIIADVYPGEDRLMADIFKQGTADVIPALKTYYNIDFNVPLDTDLKINIVIRFQCRYYVCSSLFKNISHNSIFARIYICYYSCLLYTSPSPRDGLLSRMPSSA